MAPSLSPTLGGFITFLYGNAKIPTTALPSDSTVIPDAFNAALSLVNKTLQLAPGGLYAYAVYNLATDFVFNWAPDVDNFTFFAESRKNFGINSAVVGTVTSSSDVSTAVGYTQPKFTEMLNMFDLQTIKTPWGRTYMGYAQQYGSIVGIS